MFNIFKKPKSDKYFSYVKPFVGMIVKHIYGEMGSGTATIIKVEGNRIIAESNKTGSPERHTYIRVGVPYGGYVKEHYVREDQQDMVFSEKILMPHA